MTSGHLQPTITFGHQSDEDFVETWLADRVLRDALAFMRAEHWSTERHVSDLPVESLICAAILESREVAVLEVRDFVVHLAISWPVGHCSVSLYSRRLSAADYEAAITQLKGWLEPRKERESNRIAFGFRYMSQHGPAYMRRSIEAPAWAEIGGNYAALVRSSIDVLMPGLRPASSTRGSKRMRSPARVSCSCTDLRARAKRTLSGRSPARGRTGATSSTSPIPSGSSAMRAT